MSITVTINNDIKIKAERGTLLSDVLCLHGANEVTASGLSIPPMPCGGMQKCKKCKVKASGALSAMTSAEKEALTQEEISEGIRFACFCKAEGNCNIYLNDESSAKVKSDGILPKFDIDPPFKSYGVAVDIGTTTIATHLYNSTGALLCKATSQNPQTRYGADVITRIGYALESTENMQIIAACVRDKINELIKEMCESENISPLEIDSAVIVGNTTMLYLLTERNPDCLSHAPFEADYLFDAHINGKEIRLIIENADVYLPPCISSFVGADITSSILASGMCNTPLTSLLVDIGTNGEIALWHEEKLLCCSTAAGPACEGAGITMGMNGTKGAIDHVFVDNGAITVHVIGDTEPIGICGSGVIDAVSCLLQTEDIDETGFMEDEEAVLSGNVVFTQKDVRMIQLAKSAICAGIDTIVEQKGLIFDKLTTFYVAGGFGSYLNIESAANIGLVPKKAPQKAAVLGNAALMGACAMLLSEQMCKKATTIANSASAIDLSTSSIFNNKYTEGMFF